MPTLPNGFEYTNTATGSVEMTHTNGYGSWQLNYTEYYSIYTNKSVLAFSAPNFKGGKRVTGEVLYVYPRSKVTDKSGILINGTNITDSLGADIEHAHYYGTTYMRIRGWGTDEWHTVNIGSNLPAAPWYSVEIEHNSDGTKSVTAQIQWNIRWEYRYEAGDDYNYESKQFDYTSSVGTITLTTIPRASTLIVPDAVVGQTKTAVLSAASTEYTHNITAAYTDGYTQTIDTSTLSWTPNATHAYASMGASNSYTTVTFTTRTYYGNALIGTTTTTAKVHSAAVAPTVTLTGVINNPKLNLTGTEKIIYNYSNITLTASATAANGATISSYIVDGTSGATKTLTVAKQHSFTAKAIDSRGVAGTATLTYAYVDYFKPVITSFSISNIAAATGEATVTAEGTYANVNFGVETNDIYVGAQVYDIDDETWSEITYSSSITKSGNTYSTTFAIPDLNYQHNYNAYLYVYDLLLAANEPDAQHIKSVPVFYWKKDSFNVNVASTLNSNLFVKGTPYIDSKSGNIALNFRSTADSSLYAAGVIQHIHNTNSWQTTFYERSQNSDGSTTNYYDIYKLPTSDIGKTASSNYDIMTSKTYDPPAVKSGTTAPSSVSTSGWEVGTIYIYHS